MKHNQTSSNDPNCFTLLLASLARHRVQLILAALLMVGLAHQAAAQTWSLGSAWSASNGTGQLANNNANRGLAYSTVSNQVFVATRNGASSAIDVFDGTTGTLLSGAGGVNGASAVVPDQIGIANDGVLYAMPLNTGVSTGSPLQLYSWTNWNSTPYFAYQSSTSDPVGTYFTGNRIGDTMAVTGSGVNTLILAAVAGYCTNFVLLHTADGVNFTATAITNVPGLPPTGASGAGNFVGICFYTNNTFLIQPGSGASSHNVYLVSYPANFASQTAVSGTLLGNAGALTAGATVFMDYSPAGRMLAMAQTANQNPNTVGIFSTTNFPSSAAQLATTNIATPNANGNNTGGAALGGQGKTNYLYVLESNNGLQAYTINYTAGTIGPTISSQPVGITNAFPPQTLTATVSGSTPFHYQWYQVSGGVTNPVGANTNFYTVTTPVTNSYYVVITNAGGSITSSVVGLSLLTPISNPVVTPLWNASVGAFSFLTTGDNTRGLAYDTNSHRVVVASYSSGSTLYLLDGNTGAYIGAMNMPGSGFPGLLGGIDQVGVADDGAVYACNLVNAGGTFDLYQWSAPDTTGTAVLAFTGDPGPGYNDRWGDTMAVRGAGTATQILLGSKGTNVVLFTTTDGTSFTPTLIAITNVPSGFAGNGVAFGAGNTFWAKETGGDLYEVAFDPAAQTGGSVLDFSASGQIPSNMTGVGADPVNNIVAGIMLSDQNNDLQLFQLSGTADPPVLFDQAFFPSFNVNGNGNGVVVMKYPRVYALDVNNGIVAATYGVPATTAPTITAPPGNQTVYTNNPAVIMMVGVSGSLPLYYQWRFNGANISGATSRTYTLNYPPMSASGNYDVVVHNTAGTQTSSPPAVLTVLVPTSSTVVTQAWTLAAGSRGYLDSSSYNTRGLAYDTNTETVLVCDHANIYVLAATNGQDLFQLDTTGLPTGGVNGWTLNQIGVADDGVVYGANLVVEGGTTYDIVSWSAVSGSATLNYAYGGASGADPGNGSGDRWGDTMAVRGAGVNTEILLGSYSGTNVVLFTTTDGINFTPNLIPVAGPPAGFCSLGIAFGAGDTFWTKGGHNYNLRQVSFNRSTWTGTVLQTYLAGTQVPNDLTGLGVDVAAGILGGVCFNDSPNSLQLYELSGNANPPALFNQAFFASNNANGQENAATTLKAGKAFGLNVNNGLVALTYGTPAAPRTTIISVTWVSGVGATITWQAFNARSYQVQFKNALTDANWTDIGAPIVGATATAAYTDATATGAKRYYRIKGL
jgi:hypothetical protein